MPAYERFDQAVGFRKVRQQVRKDTGFTPAHLMNGRIILQDSVMGSWNRRALQFFNAVLTQIAYKIGGY